jgi:DNA polymerase zeta
LFVEVVGEDLHRAFQVGAAIAEAVTKQNPKPIKLQFEKVP